MLQNQLISLKNCKIQDRNKTYLNNISWQMNCGEAWLFTGSNGGGKADFIHALSGSLEVQGEYESIFQQKVAVVSLEKAASLIEEERNRDESEYLDKEDIGRTGRQYICEVLGGSSKKNAPLPPIASRLETMPQIKLCGIEKILDRGLRYMSTGEIRRTLLCRALLSDCKLLILSNPFAGLDAESRKILLEFFDTITKKQFTATQTQSTFPRIILSMERFKEIPQSINKVLEFNNKQITFCGTRCDYQKKLEQEKEQKEKLREKEKQEFLIQLNKIREESHALTNSIATNTTTNTLIEFNNVNVGWDNHLVLQNLNWQVKANEHWLIRGPNGSGKTTILELITGDNMQVFREDIKLFGNRRGTGESIWDIKKNLGIASYRLHVEYRMVGTTDLQSVIISGFRDSIGLYAQPTDFEVATANAWLNLAGFKGREKESFSSLSYGEQRAILIIRAAVKSPKVLILDEPCHGLDEVYRTRTLDLLETIASTGTTTLLHVTHDPTEVLACEKHILELHPNQNPMHVIKTI